MELESAFAYLIDILAILIIEISKDKNNPDVLIPSLALIIIISLLLIDLVYDVPIDPSQLIIVNANNT